MSKTILQPHRVNFAIRTKAYMEAAMIIPYKELALETLNNLIEEFVTRDGTDNGYDEDVNIKIGRVLSLLKKGDIVIVYNASLESVNIIPYDSARHLESDLSG